MSGLASSPPSDSRRSARARTAWYRSTPLLVTIGAIAVVVAIAVATQQGQTPDPVVEVKELPDEVIALTPQPGDIIRLQERVGIDLRDDLTGRLVVDGVPIPDDQVIGEGGGRIYFQPAPGREIEEFAPGDHQITAIFWDATKTEADGAQSFSWSFRAA